MEELKNLNKLFSGSYFTGKTFRAIVEALRIVGSEVVNNVDDYVYSLSEVKKIMQEFEQKRRE